MQAYITDNLGQKWELVSVFNHESQEFMTVLEFMPEEQS